MRLAAPIPATCGRPLHFPSLTTGGTLALLCSGCRSGWLCAMVLPAARCPRRPPRSLWRPPALQIGCTLTGPARCSRRQAGPSTVCALGGQHALERAGEDSKSQAAAANSLPASGRCPRAHRCRLSSAHVNRRGCHPMRPPRPFCSQMWCPAGQYAEWGQLFGMPIDTAGKQGRGCGFCPSPSLQARACSSSHSTARPTSPFASQFAHSLPCTRPAVHPKARLMTRSCSQCPPWRCSWRLPSSFCAWPTASPRPRVRLAAGWGGRQRMLCGARLVLRYSMGATACAAAFAAPIQHAGVVALAFFPFQQESSSPRWQSAQRGGASSAGPRRRRWMAWVPTCRRAGAACCDFLQRCLSTGSSRPARWCCQTLLHCLTK